MLARGFQNEIRTLTDYRLRPADWLMLAVSTASAAVAIYAGQVWL
jgi:hypothetical protein